MTKSNGTNGTHKQQVQCTCGCGEMTANLFKPGHDARLKSILRKIAEGDTSLSIPALARERAKEIGFVRADSSLAKVLGTRARRSN